MDDDQNLVADVLANRPQAFERLVLRHQRLVWSLVYRMVQHDADTEELCQDVFMRVHRYLPTFRFDSALSTWIGQIAFSVAGRHLQRKRIPLHVSSAEDESDPLQSVADSLDLEQQIVSEDMGRRVDVALQGLSPIQRTLVSLYYQDELSVGEIAVITELPEGTVKNYLFRARAALRRKLVTELGVAA